MSGDSDGERLRDFLREAIHAINSPIGVILGTTQFLSGDLCGKRLEEVSEEEFLELQEALAVIERQGRRCADLARGMRALAHAGQLETEPTDVGSCLRAAREGINWARAGTEVKEEVDSGLPFVMADAEKLTETFTAIARNADEAMPDGGTFLLSAQKTESGIEVRFGDTGVGMSPEERVKIFSPFYSTKAEEGRGWGLAIASLVLDAHGAALEVKSGPGKGTEILIRFPGA